MKKLSSDPHFPSSGNIVIKIKTETQKNSYASVVSKALDVLAPVTLRNDLDSENFTHGHEEILKYSRGGTQDNYYRIKLQIKVVIIILLKYSFTVHHSL